MEATEEKGEKRGGRNLMKIDEKPVESRNGPGGRRRGGKEEALGNVIGLIILCSYTNI